MTVSVSGVMLIMTNVPASVGAAGFTVKQCDPIGINRPRKTESVTEDDADSCQRAVFEAAASVELDLRVDAPQFTSTASVLAVSQEEPDGVLRLRFSQVQATAACDESTRYH